MTKASDMSTPVTRGELKEELAKLRTEVSREIAEAIAPLATKVELEMWGGALLDRIERLARQGKELQADLLRQGKELQADLLRQGKELQADLSRQINAALESIPAMIRPIDDKYSDLPTRVSVLEAAVFDRPSR